MSTPTVPQPVWSQDVMAEEPIAGIDWLWHGFIARGYLTLLTSLWKAGKTTLVSLLLARRKLGGSLAGLPVSPGKTAVITEEHRSLWAERIRRGDFGNNVCFFPRPFSRIPTPEEWQALIDRIVQLRNEHGIDLVVIDPLAPLLRDENNARCVLECLLPLSAFTQQGMAVLVVHHPSKGKVQPGQAARGSGALLGHADISIEMRHPGGDPLTRRRRFLAFSRLADTPRQLLLELNPEGCDYVVPPESDAEDFHTGWDVLRLVLDDAPQKLTRNDILLEWPTDFKKPDQATLWKWLDRAVQSGLSAREGSGKKSDPFRYWLPAREEVWKESPIYELFEQQRKDLNLPFKPLHGRKR